MIGLIRSYLRPDGGCVVRADGGWTIDRAMAAVELARSRSVTVITDVDESEEADQQILAGAGFTASPRWMSTC